MKFLKNHLSLIFALVSILFSIEIFSLFTKIVSTYESKIVQNYTAIIVSTKKIDKLNIQNISSIEKVDIENSLKNLKNELKNFDLEKLKTSIPYFYKLHFSKLPTPTELKQMERKLKKLDYIKKVESFRSSQTKIYNLLLIIKIITTIFMIIILFISFLLIIKQMEVWKLEHSERMYIMELFGAPLLLRSGILLRLAIIDSILSVIFIGVIINYLLNSDMYKNILVQLQINIQTNMWLDLTIFLGISLFIALLATFIVILTKKRSV